MPAPESAPLLGYRWEPSPGVPGNVLIADSELAPECPKLHSNTVGEEKRSQCARLRFHWRGTLESSDYHITERYGM